VYRAQALQRLSLALTWATDLGTYTSWLPSLLAATVVEPALAASRVVAPVAVAAAPLAVLAALAAALAVCSAGARAQFHAGLLWRALRAAASWLFPTFSVDPGPTFSLARVRPLDHGRVHVLGGRAPRAHHRQLDCGRVLCCWQRVPQRGCHIVADARRARRRAGSHGRADAGACLVDALLVVVLCALRGRLPAALSAMLAFCGALGWLGLALAFHPFVRPSLNSAACALLAVHVWVAMYGSMLQSAEGTFPAAAILITGIVPSMGGGFGLCEQRLRRARGARVAELASVYSFDIKVREQRDPSARARVCVCVCACACLRVCVLVRVFVLLLRVCVSSCICFLV
jgi:hypothetical protein